jgi:hypothetical protein
MDVLFCLVVFTLVVAGFSVWLYSAREALALWLSLSTQADRTQVLRQFALLQALTIPGYWLAETGSRVQRHLGAAAVWIWGAVRDLFDDDVPEDENRPHPLTPSGKGPTKEVTS